MSLITTLLLVFVAAILGGLVAKYLRMPLITGYIAIGVLLGNLFSGAVDRVFIEQIAESGVVLLLFTLGLEFSFQRLRRVMHTIPWAATLQIFLSLIIFLPVFFLFGYGFLPSLYLAVAASLSSTAVAVRILSERGELETVPGEVTTAWLIVQDLAVIPIMMILPALSQAYLGGTSSVVATVALILVSFLKATIAIIGILFLGKIAIPRFLQSIARLGAREVLLLAVVGIVFLSGTIAYSVGLSAALGAFIAGLLVAETSVNHSVFSEIRPLRDLFAVVFFVSLGMSLPIRELIPVVIPIVIATVVIIIGKSVIVYPIVRFIGYHRKTAFLIAIGLTHVSEFGFVIARVGLAVGAINNQTYVFLVAIVFTTLLVSAPVLAQGNSLYYQIRRLLGRSIPRFFPDRKEEVLFHKELTLRDHVVVCGYGRVGKYIGRALSMVGVPFVVVDYDQGLIRDLRNQGVPVIYGDPADMDVLDFAEVEHARVVIIAIPDRHTQEMIIANSQTLNKGIHIMCRTHHEEDQVRLKTLGVATIVQPEFEAALSLVTKLFREYAISEEEIPGKLHRLKIEHGMG
jgi:CPA2 family monovalent cation:H+ antiporter-2